MALAWWCVLAGGVMPVLLAGLAKSGGGYDNARPRDFVSGLDGFHKRAYAAQLNGFEAFPLFAAAVAAATLNGVAQGWIDALAAGWLVARIAYSAAYVGDRPTLRSLLWTVAFGCAVGLFVAPLLR